jgi:hypothetical protein
MNPEFTNVRIQIGSHALFTRVFLDGKELRGITRVWFDSGDVDDGYRPRKAWRDTTRVHLEFLPRSLLVEGDTTVDLVETVPVRL